MDTRYLEILIAFQTHKTLTKAAEHLGISQPALSRSLQKLEEEMEVPLFHRTKNSLLLNENGKYLAKQAEHLLKQEHEMKEKLKIFDETHRTLHIGYSAPAPKNIYEIQIQQLYPQATITWTMQENEKQLLLDLQQGKYTCVFLTSKVNNPSCYQKQCCQEHLYLSILPAHPASNYTQGITFSDIDGQTFLMNNHIGVWNDVVKKHLSNSKFLRQNNIEDLDTLIHGSAFPTFHTNLTDKKRIQNTNRILIPFLDADATKTFYCVILKKNAKQFGTLFQLFTKKI